ncbi:1-deoxy-D-xylulose-5-phosphate reductoisomerase [Candidatus Peregrinibacteria bacterium CG_4_9_14_0_2_um_filter_53_11]|nr:MAG: 1-deoxy-D-xylulose-5-phosphate reductoisomerase [Candidatus Peregrinibacteria bacterium CG_4_9_14_0_2_um_filter_53_11]
MKRIVILGSTGSIGTQVLDVVRAHPDAFEVIGISAYEDSALLERQNQEFKPRYVVQAGISENPTQVLSTLAAVEEADIIVNAIAGSAGLFPTLAAVQAGKTVALANKESLVMAGELVMQTARRMGGRILPIDSEPSAIWQALLARSEAVSEPTIDGVEKVILTASGGPFWRWNRQNLEHVTLEEALKHPTWQMGEKISVDSATLMNKAFEIIETKQLFGLQAEKIDVTIHRQSLVHSFVQYDDGNMHAVLAPTDMRIPTHYALFYPNRQKNSLPRIDLSQLTLTFEAPDYSIFEGPKLAYEVIKAGGLMPAIFCLADERAVRRFCDGEIGFLDIYDEIKRALDEARNEELTLDSLRELISRMV